MKKHFVLFCVILIAAASTCVAQESASKASKSPSKEGAIIDLEKSITDAYKNKQTDAFKKYLAPDYVGINVDGITTVDSEVTGMEKNDLRNYSFADTKVVFPRADLAVVAYKATVQSSSGGKDTSGTYNVASVWMKRSGNWLLISHAFMKSQ
jgi:ketosteroid isomerase-like protein